MSSPPEFGHQNAIDDKEGNQVHICVIDQHLRVDLEERTTGHRSCVINDHADVDVIKFAEEGFEGVDLVQVGKVAHGVFDFDVRILSLELLRNAGYFFVVATNQKEVKSEFCEDLGESETDAVGEASDEDVAVPVFLFESGCGEFAVGEEVIWQPVPGAVLFEQELSCLKTERCYSDEKEEVFQTRVLFANE
jgi:hypothetical protein